ncbi:peptidase M23, partial [Acinetobacter variabilis]
PTPTPTPSTEIQENKIVGGSGLWVDPLAINQLRVAGLANVKSATFGKVRNGGTRNHQGIELAADSGTNIFAVCSGVIAIATDSGKAYG